MIFDLFFLCCEGIFLDVSSVFFLCFMCFLDIFGCFISFGGLWGDEPRTAHTNFNWLQTSKTWMNGSRLKIRFSTRISVFAECFPLKRQAT